MKTLILATALTVLTAQSALAANTLSQRKNKTVIEKACRLEATKAAVHAIIDDRFDREKKVDDISISESGFYIDNETSNTMQSTVMLTISSLKNSLQKSEQVKVNLKINNQNNTCTAVPALIEDEG